MEAWPARISSLFIAIAVTAVSAILFVACSGPTGTSPASPERQADARNSTYTITCDGILSKGFQARLQNGEATVSGKEAGSPEYDHFEITYQASASGVVTGDTAAETAVLLLCSPQPSNFAVQEVLVLQSDSQLRGRLPAGDSLRDGAVLPPKFIPSELTIVNGNISAGMLRYGPGDTHASGPTNHVTMVFHWSGSAFARLT